MFQSNNLTACYDPDVIGWCSESDLDVQSITSYGVGAEFGFLPGGQQAPFASDYDNFVYYREAFIENDFTPDVLSLSWGYVRWSILEDLEDILMEFTAAGITILVASGKYKLLSFN